MYKNWKNVGRYAHFMEPPDPTTLKYCTICKGVWVVVANSVIKSVKTDIVFEHLLLYLADYRT